MARPAGHRIALLAVGVATLALLVAFGAFGFAWRAVDRAEDAKTTALGQPAQDPTPSSASGGETATPEESATVDAPTPANPRSPGEAPLLNERTVYRPKYDKQTLILKTRCGYSMYADLDEPRAQNEDTGADLRLVMGCGGDPTVFRLGDGVEGSDAAESGMGPQDCADKIRIAPVGEGAPVPVRKGAALCITTDYGRARASGDEWRMVLIEVMGVANDGATTVQVTAWDIPDA
ncbi:hypothetical protein D7147_30620 [Micromonospora musae]|uniref:Serine/threonine protein kinase n=1 Tax=Micromonospora musae TaxID=1894970 RepID=A0ABX9QTP6_9ACTN|nr:hypothetical protein [Micromonospora musae]RKN13793.1 hypothetical protein D7147_30620 [Micromonospora musae]